MSSDSCTLAKIVENETGTHHENATLAIYLLFFTSGIPAILYQIVWQRALFALFGINIESVTIVVSAFMLGLGVGSLAGGALSKSRRLQPVLVFAAAELGIAIFGLVSLSIFHRVAEYTRSSPLWITGIVSFLLVVVPTTLMGSTLPLLIEHLVRTSRNVGGSVGALYFVNTLGSGAACIVVVRPLMNSLGQAGAVRCAAALNALVGISALIYALRLARNLRKPEAVAGGSGLSEPMLPFAVALLCAGLGGFTALSYEIIWYRLLAFACLDTAPIFASLLGSYLVGIALGSRFAEGYAERHSAQATLPVLATSMVGSVVVSFWVNPLSAWLLRIVDPQSASSGWVSSLVFLFLICHATILFGAVFPLLAHVAVAPRQAGAAVSYLYVANIVGSTLGVLLVGFVLMERFSLYQIGQVLLFAGILSAVVVYRSVGRRSKLQSFAFAAACIAAIVIAPVSRPVFATIYDRLLFKKYYPLVRFAQVIENRSGTIGVTPDEAIYGGGVYDGRFSTDLLNDSNIIVRPYAVSAFHARPSQVLMIGLGSGSWAQVIANHPQLQQLIVVDINPGYLQAIPKHARTASLLRNPKVRIVIDDGRRWLLRNPQASFDAVLMNTSFHWRNHSTNLLSADFLRIVRSHLNPGGVFLYNTTYSEDVVATGLSVFPYGLRVYNAIVLSDSPLVFDRARWKTVLLNYVIDGKRVVDANDPEQMKRLEQVVNVPEAPPVGEWESIETNDEMRRRFGDRENLIITDDNMGVEWR